MTDATTIAVGSAVISLMSFVISACTMYFSWLRHGQLCMTQPALIFFGFDGADGHAKTAKIFLRTLLYSTAVKGKVIESMYVKIQHNGKEQIFSFWGYGETDKLTPGSGLYVGQAGVTANHHFVQSVHQSPFAFIAGGYVIEVYARLVGKSAPIQLSSISVTLEDQHASALSAHSGVLFEQEPHSGIYVGHANDRF
jgi:hypothetical protein